MLITKTQDLEKALALIHKSEKLVYDIETTGLNTRKDKIIGFGLSNGTDSVYLAHLAWDGSQLVELLTHAECKMILEALKAHDTKLVAHNASFDLRFTLHYFKINLMDQLWSDSMLAKHTCDEDFPFGLKDIAANLYGDESKEEQALMKASIKANGGTVNEFYKADLDLMAKYCIQDCLLTWKINKHYLTDLETQGLTKFYFEDEVMPLYKYVIIPMELSGVHLNMDLLQSTKIELDASIEKLDNDIQVKLAPHTTLFENWYLNKEHPVSTTGPFVQMLAESLNVNLPRLESGRFSLAAKHIDALPNGLLFKRFLLNGEKLTPATIKHVQLACNGGRPKVNLSSKHHLKKIFFDTLNCEPLSRTPTGMPQVDDTFLESVRHKYDFVPLLQDYNKLIKIKGTYIDRLLEEQENGKYYPSFQMHRTVSGRLSSDLQQLPRKLEKNQASEIVLKFNNVIRDLIVAPNGYALVSADYESLEPKVFSHASGDDGLKNIFKEGQDFYSKIAIMTEKLQDVSAYKSAPNYLGKVNKAARQKAKAYSLGVPYGLTGYKLQYEIDVDQKTADQLVADYLAAYPKLAQFMHQSKNEAKTKGFVRSETGRIRHLKRAKFLHWQHGDDLLDSLYLWKEYHEEPGKYRQMKELRKEYSNLLNNAINFKIQSLAASIVSRASIKLSQLFIDQGLDAIIILNAHDEILVQCKLDIADKVSYLVKDTLENTYKISVPLIAEPSIGNVYGQIK